MQEPAAEKDLLKLNKLNLPQAPPAPRRPRRKLPAGIVLFRVVVGLFMVTVFYQVAAWAFRPYCQAWLVERDLPGLQANLQQLENKSKDLQWRLKYAQTPEGQRAMAREYGYLQPGEISVKMKGIPEAAILPAAEPRPLNVGERLMLLFCRICRAGPTVTGSPSG